MILTEMTTKKKYQRKIRKSKWGASTLCSTWQWIYALATTRENLNSSCGTTGPMLQMKLLTEKFYNKCMNPLDTLTSLISAWAQMPLYIVILGSSFYLHAYYLVMTYTSPIQHHLFSWNHITHINTREKPLILCSNQLPSFTRRRTYRYLVKISPHPTY